MPTTDTQFTVSTTSTIPGYNFGGSGMPISTGWYGTDAWTTISYFMSQGMQNIFNTDIRKHSPGDLNVIDLNVQTRGGQVDCSAEGVSMVRPYLQVGIPPYQATIAIGGPQTTNLGMSGINGQTPGVGQTMLDLSAVVSCNVLSTTAVFPPSGGSYMVMKTDGTFTPSQQITLTATSLAVTDPNNGAGTVQTLNFSVGTGNPIQVGALIKMGGVFPEAIRVITANPVDSNGNQNITALVRAQHWGGTIGMIGGPAGMYLEQTQFTKNGYRFVSHVYGAADAQTLWVFNVIPGGMDMGYLFTGPVNLYWGATITDIRNADGVANGYTLDIEANNGAWPVGGSVEQPNHATAWWQGYVSLIQNNNPFSSGAHFRIGGNGSAFGSVGQVRLFDIRNSEPASSYNIAGGHYQPITAFSFSGVFGGMFTFDTMPHGPLFLAPVDSGAAITLFACSNRTAYINLDTGAPNGGARWVYVADQVALPGATFSTQGVPATEMVNITSSATIQGGGSSVSLTVITNSDPMYPQPALHVQGDMSVDGKILIGGKPIGVAEVSPAGYTGTVQAGAAMTFKNGLLINVS